MVAKRVADTAYTLRFLKLLTTPFDKTDAFKQGLIDADGKRTSVKITNNKHRNAYTYFHRLAFNLKRILNTTGHARKVSSYIAALYLVKEHKDLTEDTMQKIVFKLPIDEQLQEQCFNNWVKDDEDNITTGVLKLRCDMVDPVECNELYRAGDRIRVQQKEPIDYLIGAPVYEGIHLNTGLPIYFTSGDVVL